MNFELKAKLENLKSLQEAIVKGREYLKDGKHADWSGFRPVFYGKKRDGKELPPHKDWVKNVFIPRNERALKRCQKILDKLTEIESKVDRDKQRRQGRKNAI